MNHYWCFSSRSVLIKLVNKNMATEILGLALMANAWASVIGPLIVGWIFDAYGSYRSLSILIMTNTESVEWETKVAPGDC